MNVLKKVFRRIFRVHHYQLFKAACNVIQQPRLGDHEEDLVIDAANINQNTKVLTALNKIAADTVDYLEDVNAGRVVALVILHQGEVVHYSYVFLRNKSACVLGLDRDTALVGNAFTVQSYRGKGCQARSVALRAAIAQDRGFRFIAAETSPENLASQRGLQNGGMGLVGRLDLAVILNCLVIRWRRPPGVSLLGFCLRA